MSYGFTNYGINKILDTVFRDQAIGMSSSFFIALIVATKKVATTRSVAVSVGDTILPATPNGRIYRCTTAGTCGAAAPTWPTTDDATVADGTAVWTECTALHKDATFTEAAGGDYARVEVVRGLSAFCGTQGTGSTTASTGTSGRTSNNAAVVFPAPTADWGFVWGFAVFTASTGGNCIGTAANATPLDVLSGQAAPQFPIDALGFTQV
jgi:hypothetical protein